ncbi:MAG: NUDIX domain-containing protein [Gammaproteobacteria bacterium]|nr:NUDIX domain-containing protein [Gammaproteobacteria bacterium]
MREHSVVTAFLRHEGEILLVRRSQDVGTYKGRWSAISGYLEHAPLEQAHIEIVEETGLSKDDVELVSVGKALYVSDEKQGIRWTIYPFLFDIKQPERIRLDWENQEMRWVLPDEIDQYPTVPALAQTLAACLDVTPYHE